MLELLFSLLMISGLAPSAPPAPTAAPAPARTELPIRAVASPGGAPRYSVMLTINGKPVEAALDTGSVGLRVVGPALPSGSSETGETVGIGFNSGSQLMGKVVRAKVAYGTLRAAEVRVQRIDRADCRRGVPRCDASGTKISNYRIMRERPDDQGFVAILGIGLRPERLGHPLEQAGVTRWIVELPRNAGETGRLILNPTDEEVADYRPVRLLPGRNEIEGCIAGEGRRVCAPAMIDSGAPGITLFGMTMDALPEPGTEATLSLGQSEDAPSMTLTVGDRAQGGSVRVRGPRPDAPTSLSFGVAPYLHWSILYDARTRMLGVSDR